MTQSKVYSKVSILMKRNIHWHTSSLLLVLHVVEEGNVAIVADSYCSAFVD